MKTRIMSFLIAGCFVALAAWLVNLNNNPAPVAQGRESKPGKGDEIPEKYRKTVDKGLEYLVKNQFKDGHWEGDDGKHPVAMTGLAGLALLMEGGSRERRNVEDGWEYGEKYKANIGKAADWLVDKSKAGRDGLIFSEHPSERARYMQGHSLATLFLAGVCKYERDDARRKKLTDVLIRAVKYIVKAQSSQGGWHDTSKVEGHDFANISATVIQMQALQAADNAGIPISGDALNDAQEYLKTAIGNYDEQAKPGHNHGRPADIAGAFACGSNGRHGLVEGWCEQWLKYCQTEIPMGSDVKFGRDELTHYYYAQALFNMRGEKWSGYRTTMFDHLQSTQNKDGSWPAGDGISVGSVYATAVWCTVFQYDKNRHPSTQRLLDVK